jgi:uncharacterized protein (DUF58 family)
MIPKEVLRKVRQIQITTRHMVNDVLAGDYQSAFRGRGMEFEEVREYQPGDEVRSIDWNVTARMGHPYVKRYVEERELTVMLLVDMSSSGKFGTTDRLKQEVTAELCAVLAFSAIIHNDKVGVILFTDAIEKFIPPKKGPKHVLRVIRELLYHEPKGSGTDIAAALEYLNKITRRRAVVFLVSDFLSEGYERDLQISSKRHDLIPITITDPREVEFPKIGLIELEDAETGERVVVDFRSLRARREYASGARSDYQSRKEMFRSVGIDSIDVVTDKPYIHEILKFFRMRERRQ